MFKSWMWKQRSYREQFQGTEGGAAAGGTAEAQQDDEQDSAAQAEGETPDDEQSDTPPAAQAEEDGEVVITIGDEAPPASEDEVDGKPAPAWLKDLRKSDREKSKRIRELEQAAAAREAAAAPSAPTVAEKPTLESVEYDAEAYAEKLLAWTDAKRKADEQAAAARAEQDAAQAAWTAKLTAYNASKAALKVDDFDGAEHVVRENMNQTQQAILLKLPRPEMVVYAVGKNPARAKELAAIKDPIDFAFAVAKLETQLKVAPRKTPPAPEREVRGTAGGAVGVDNARARLEAEADRTGDRSKLIAYDRQKRRAAA